MNSKPTIKNYDFTGVLEELPNVYKFNPSIAYWKEDFYLCVYRRFVRYPTLNQRGPTYNYTLDPLTDPNHPWLGGVPSATFFNPAYGYDSIGICILKINEHNEFTLIANYADELIKGKDARLLRVATNHFIVSYNVVLNHRPDILLKGGENCEIECGLIATCVIELNDEATIKTNPPVILCPNFSARIEKNWSFWTTSSGVSFSYGLFPKHEIFDLKITSDSTLQCGNNRVIHQSQFITEFIKYYQNEVKIFVTTPAINYDKNKKIGVGYIKFKYDELTLSKLPENSHLRTFVKQGQTMGRKFHPLYACLMFFYFFNPIDGKIEAISVMFLPERSTMYCTPSGLTWMKGAQNKLLLSYGDADSSSKAMILSKEEISAIISPVQIENKILLPQTITFLMFDRPEEKEARKERRESSERCS